MSVHPIDVEHQAVSPANSRVMTHSPGTLSHQVSLDANDGQLARLERVRYGPQQNGSGVACQEQTQTATDSSICREPSVGRIKTAGTPEERQAPGRLSLYLLP